jgi:hypothetical protein
MHHKSRAEGKLHARSTCGMILAVMSPMHNPALTRAAYRTALFAVAGGGAVMLFVAARALGADLGVAGIPEPIVRGVGHFAVYGMLAVAVAMACGRQFLLAWLAVMLLATAEELHQLVVPYRYACVHDWLINLAGVTTCLLCAWAWPRRRRIAAERRTT